VLYYLLNHQLVDSLQGSEFTDERSAARLAGHNYLNMLQRDAVPQTAMLFEHERRIVHHVGLEG
jgi:hypothetical protein